MFAIKNGNRYFKLPIWLFHSSTRSFSNCRPLIILQKKKIRTYSIFHTANNECWLLELYPKYFLALKLCIFPVLWTSKLYTDENWIRDIDRGQWISYGFCIQCSAYMYTETELNSINFWLFLQKTIFSREFLKWIYRGK